MNMDIVVKYIKYSSGNNMYYEQIPNKTKDKYVVEGLGEKWETVDDDPVWTYHHIPGIFMPTQGWKVHISTVYNEADKVLSCISKILINLEIPFKHIKNRGVLLEMYSKNGNRINSGKFITIYPQGEELSEILEVLEKNLVGFKKGPYILTDSQWKDTNIFFRYGAFKKILNSTGELCLVDADGNLIPDVRKATYYVPDFVKVPKVLKEIDVSFNKNNLVENKLKLYRIDKALRFTNSGGIYIAERIADGLKCVIKEARAEIGFDGAGRTAAQRLENEYISLGKLKDVSGVVNIIDYFKVWDNMFLVEEFVDGITLAQWVAINYPYSPNDNVQEYFSKVFKIMNKLKNIVNMMHKYDVAMRDLQTQNLLVDDELNITLIDFELATSCSSEESAGMATKGFVNSLNKKASEKDWYALNRILQYALLPIGSVTDLDITLNKTHCSWIKDVYGDVAYDWFLDYQLECCDNITNSEDIFKGTYSLKDKTNHFVNLDNTEIMNNILNGLLKGLIDNCKVCTESLINGDIRQFDMNCGKLNLLNGGFGAVLTINRNNGLSDSMKKWIDGRLEDILKSDYNNGFLSGRAGIAATLYECGYIKESIELVEVILHTYSIDTFDFTLRSGLSGIGLMLVAFYAETQNQKYLDEAFKIAANMMEKISKNQKLITTDWDSVQTGIIDGYAGMALFYSLLYKVSQKESYLISAKELILKDIESSNISTRDGSMQTFDENKNRLLPYLANGSIGLGIAISVYNSVSGEKAFKQELEAIFKVSEYKCCFDAGLLDGSGGFFILSTLPDANADNIIQKSLEKLNLFLIEIQDKKFIPGKLFYKLSSDMYSGSAGIILAIQSAQNKNSLLWLPLLHKLIN